jgi:hypothetical protein
LTLATVVAPALASGTTAAPRAHAGFTRGTAARYGVLVEPGAHRFPFDNSSIGNVSIDAGLGNSGARHR